MLRFLLGIIFAQFLTGVLLWLNADSLSSFDGWVRVLIPLVAVTLVTTFWFGAISRQISDARIQQLRDEFSREREDFKTKAERDKAQVLKTSQQEIKKEIRLTHAKANFKVGMALTGAIGFGVLMMFTQFATAGLLLLTAAGGTLGGYMMRLRRERAIPVPSLDKTPFNIVSTSKQLKQHK